MIFSRSLKHLVVTGLMVASTVGVGVAAIVNTTTNDFIQPGTQPNTLTTLLSSTSACEFCHGFYDPDDEPYERWAGSMMANAMRDPIYHAAVVIAEQDAGGSSDFCIRCHTPNGWLEGRNALTGPNAVTGTDYQGISCHFCHRMVDPVADPANPGEDAAILAGLAQIPPTSSSGQYIVDPDDLRRGPYQLVGGPFPGFPHHEWRESPHHRESLNCASCHELSNPILTRVGGMTPAASDTYVLNTLDTEAPSHVKTEQFPSERTYTEWALSDFAVAPIDMGGLFGGNNPLVSSCQDCHMPDTTGTGCNPGFPEAVVRTDLAQHDFNGANSWVPLSIFNLDQTFDIYGAGEASGLQLSVFQDAVDRNISMLERAAEMDVSFDGDDMIVRVTNNSGHKLPTGYHEGRRMWLNIKFFDHTGTLIVERGAYDFVTADLTTGDTKVYERKDGIDSVQAAATGLPVGESFHFILNNDILKDNRIPPRGFNNAAFEAGQANPVGYSYADGQFWDDTTFAIPANAKDATVTLYHQTTSKEYIDFLKNENVTDNRGDVAYDQWVLHGMSEPVEMEKITLGVAPRLSSDVDQLSVSSGGVATFDLAATTNHAGQGYWVFATMSGTTPGIPIPGTGLVLPINFDSVTMLTIVQPNLPPLGNSLGVLNASGDATMTVTLPGGVLPAGLTLDHAYVVFLPGTGAVAVSNAASLELIP